jgi:hypothetical protein
MSILLFLNDKCIYSVFLFTDVVFLDFIIELFY